MRLGGVATTSVWLVAAAIATAGCSPAEAPLDVEPDLPVVFITEARIETLRDSFVAMGRVVPATTADWTVVAPRAAQIVSLTKTVGDPVAAGEQLIVFEIRALTQNVEARELAVAQASAQVGTARTEAARLSSLYDRGVVARNQRDAAQAALRTAEAAAVSAEAYLTEARLMADQANVTARFAGVVTDVWHMAGDFVSPDPADPILRIIDPSRIEVSLPVPVVHLGRLVEGRTVTIQPLGVDTLGTATISRRRAPADADSPTAELRLTPDDPTGLALETAIRVEILLEERRNVVVVPVSALLRDATSSFVMIADDDGRAWRRNISVGLVTPDRAEVVQGLAPGEAVISSGGADLLDGDLVTVNR